MADRNELDSIERALNESAAKTGTLWISFISLVVYLVIAAGSVTHRMLFLQEPIRLPVLNVDLPLVGFFIVAPLLLVTYHFYLLLQLAVLSNKAAVYERTLREELAARTERDDRRQRLDQFPFIQLLVGGGRRHGTSVRTATVVISVVTVVGAPVLALMMVQIVFVPYHDVWVTWLHRFTVILDIVLLWAFWSNGSFSSVTQPRGGGLQPVHVPMLASALALTTFSIFVATFPGEGPVALRQYFRGAAELTRVLFAGPVDKVSGSRTSLFSNTLILSEQGLVDRERAEKLEERLRTDANYKDQFEPLRTFRSRDLRGGVFNGADLRFVDFTAANLRDASLVRTRVTGAKFDCVFIAPKEVRSDKRRAIVDRDYDNDDSCASLNGATLDRAVAQDASFDGARLLGTVFDDASLQGVNFHKAKIWGSSFARAKLQGAKFENSDIAAASFASARMHAVDLREATIVATSFSHSVMPAAIFEEAAVSATALLGTQLHGANLDRATFDMVSFTWGANLWRASIDKATLTNISAQSGPLSRSTMWPSFRGSPVTDLKDEGGLHEAIAMATADVVFSSTRGRIEQRMRLRLSQSREGVERDDVARDRIKKEAVAMSELQSKLLKSLQSLVCGNEAESDMSQVEETSADPENEEAEDSNVDGVETTPQELDKAALLLRGIIHNSRLLALTPDNMRAFRGAIIDPVKCPLLPASRREDLDAVDGVLAKKAKPAPRASTPK